MMSGIASCMCEGVHVNSRAANAPFHPVMLSPRSRGDASEGPVGAEHSEGRGRGGAETPRNLAIAVILMGATPNLEKKNVIWPLWTWKRPGTAKTIMRAVSAPGAPKAHDRPAEEQLRLRAKALYVLLCALRKEDRGMRGKEDGGTDAQRSGATRAGALRAAARAGRDAISHVDVSAKGLGQRRASWR